MSEFSKDGIHGTVESVPFARGKYSVQAGGLQRGAKGGAQGTVRKGR